MGSRLVFIKHSKGNSDESVWKTLGLVVYNQGQFCLSWNPIWQYLKTCGTQVGSGEDATGIYK